MGWISEFLDNASKGFGGGGGESGASAKKRIKLGIRNDITAAQIDDATRNKLLSDIDSVPEVDTPEWDSRISSVLETLKQRKALSSEVAAKYADAVEQAKKRQSTIITKGIPSAVAPQGNSTSLITSGQVK